MATTFKQLLNRALKITAEDTIDTGSVILTDDVHVMLGEVCMELKEEVEDAHNWRALRQQVTVSLASVNSGTITEANERSRLIRIHEPHYGELVPLVFDITDASSPFRLRELDLPELLRRRTMDPNTTADPSFFAIDNSAGDVLKIEVYPTPGDTRTIQLDMIIPQDRLDGVASADDLNTNIKVPVRPITMALVRYILEERGEELGINSQYSEEKEGTALRDAISRDLAEQGDDSLVVT
jgi:hypothetical protein